MGLQEDVVKAKEILDSEDGNVQSSAYNTILFDLIEKLAKKEYPVGVETETDIIIDGEKVYQTYLTGEGFSNPGGYTLIPHGITAPFRVVEVSGWCDYTPGSTANMYATYFDGLGNIRSSWTSANPDKPWRITIKYLKG